MKWNELSLRDKSNLMALFLDNGVSSLKEMRHIYDGTKDNVPMEVDGNGNLIDSISPATVSESLSRDEWNDLYRQGKIELSNVPRRYQSWIEGNKGRDIRKNAKDLRSNREFSFKDTVKSIENLSKDVVSSSGFNTALDFTPIVGDAKGIFYDPYIAYKEGGIWPALGTVGMGLVGLLPGGDIIKGIKNVRKYRRNVNKKIFDIPVQHTLNRYRDNYGVLKNNLNAAGIDINDKSVLDKEVIVKRNYIRPVVKKVESLLGKKSINSVIPGGSYDAVTIGDDTIEINPYVEFIEAWKNPEGARAEIARTLSHEGTHIGLNRLGDKLKIQGNNYFIANPEHPLFESTTYAFSDPTRKVYSEWNRNPEEFIADLNRFRLNYMRHFPEADFRHWPPEIRQKAINYLSEVYNFSPEDTEYIINKLSDFGYSHGGILNK